MRVLSLRPSGIRGVCLFESLCGSVMCYQLITSREASCLQDQTDCISGSISAVMLSLLLAVLHVQMPQHCSLRENSSCSTELSTNATGADCRPFGWANVQCVGLAADTVLSSELSSAADAVWFRIFWLIKIWASLTKGAALVSCYFLLDLISLLSFHIYSISSLLCNLQEES